MAQDEHDQHAEPVDSEFLVASPARDPFNEEGATNDGARETAEQYAADTTPVRATADEVPDLEDLVPTEATDPGVLIASTPATKDPIPTVLPQHSDETPEPSDTTQNTATTGIDYGLAADLYDETSAAGHRSASTGDRPADAVEDAAAGTARTAGTGDSFSEVSSQPGVGGSEQWSARKPEELEELDELTIVSRAQDGDLDAFDWLISAYQGGIFRLCLRMLNDRSEAEDILQETFITAWRSLPKLTVPQAFIPWLYRTATNKCLDELRRRQRRPTDPVADLGSDQDEGQVGGSGGRNTIGAGSPVDPAQDYETQSQMRALAEVLQTLPPGPRACWLLHEVHEFSYAEIAVIVQVPESTVRGRIARAKRLLAEGMEPWR